MDKIVAIAPAKITQIREAGRKALSPVEFEQLNELLSQLAIYGLTPYINNTLGRIMAKFGWELEVEESPEWAEALIACDVAFLGTKLKAMCRENGMSDYGHKKELCRRLYNAKVEEVVEIMKPIIERGAAKEGEESAAETSFWQRRAAPSPDRERAEAVAREFGLHFDGMQEEAYQFSVVKGPQGSKGITFYVDDLSEVKNRLAEKFIEFGLQEV